jgi:effector-binding domain-containing protein
MGYDIEVAETAEQPTAVVALATTWPDLPAEAGAAFDDVWAFLRDDGQEGLRSDGHNVILYKDGVPHAEVGVIVRQGFEDAGRVTASVLPGATVARTVHRGSYEHLADAHQAVHSWCADNGYGVTGVRWEVYGDWHEDESRLETEVAWVLAT